MKVVDLTHPIAPGMPTYPGDEPPRLTPLRAVAPDGYSQTRVTLTTHTGTHIDAPAHLFPEGQTLDAYPASHFVGRALVVDVSHFGRGAGIGIGDLEEPLRTAGDVEYLLLRTGWSRLWGSPAYDAGYPALTAQAAAWLARQRVHGVGVDAPSFDDPACAELPTHKTLLSQGILLIENLRNLEQLPATPFLFACLPLPLADADGAPARAVALL